MTEEQAKYCYDHKIPVMFHNIYTNELELGLILKIEVYTCTYASFCTCTVSINKYDSMEFEAMYLIDITDLINFCKSNSISIKRKNDSYINGNELRMIIEEAYEKMRKG